jgi:hypothetical protein
VKYFLVRARLTLCAFLRCALLSRGGP